MHSVGKTGANNPGHLFGQVCRRSPQFRGFQQQDAHELLRHLMDSLRTEEVKRQKTAILKQFGLSEKTDPKTVSAIIKKKLQALGRYSNFTIMDKIFGGQLVSTIVCEQCHNSSQMYEPFLDISLPLIEEKPQRPGKQNNKSFDEPDDEPVSCFGGFRKKKDGNDDNNEDGDSGKNKKMTKSEQKKAKAQARKVKKQNQRNTKNSKLSFDQDPLEEQDQPEKLENGDSAKESDEKTLGEEIKLQKELDENEKDKGQNSENQDKNLSNQNQDKVVEETAIETEIKKDKVIEDKNTQEEKEDHEEKKSEEKNKKPASAQAPALANRFEALQSKNKTQTPTKIIGGSEEDEEDELLIEEEDGGMDRDFEWDYDEEDTKKTKTEAEDQGNISDYIEVDEPKEESIPKVSLNPLPPERLMPRTSEEREKSSEPGQDEGEESETGSHGDIEDNLDDSKQTLGISIQDASGVLRHIKPFRPDPERLDPHMEALCRKVRKLSVSTADPNLAEDNLDGGCASKGCSRYDLSANENDPVKDEEQNYETMVKSDDEEKLQLRLQNDWIARSLTSIAPRYHAKTGECSIYSCLAQFTAPELLTGQNKWACDKCTRLHQEMTPESDSSTSGSAKPKTIYSNASKQLLIFCPPAVLTIHLKRFQQTIFNLRKVNKHVQFPLTLDLAPFCSSTSLSMPTMQAGASEILYTLFGIVEHSGRLQGGHYTAYVKLRPSQVNHTENFAKKFYSSPTARNEEIHAFLAEIQRKTCEMEAVNAAATAAAAATELPKEQKDTEKAKTETSVTTDITGKWYHISDTSVVEVSEEKVLKCQAYLLFYERFK